MLHQTIAIVLIGVLVPGNPAAQTEASAALQTTAKMQQVLQKAQEKDKPVHITLKTKIDHQKKFDGRVAAITKGDFVLTDLKSGNPRTFSYTDVREVRQKVGRRAKKWGCA